MAAANNRGSFGSASNYQRMVQAYGPPPPPVRRPCWKRRCRGPRAHGPHSRSSCRSDLHR